MRLLLLLPGAAILALRCNLQDYQCSSWWHTMQGTTAKDLHYELTPFLANNTTLFVKVCVAAYLATNSSALHAAGSKAVAAMQGIILLCLPEAVSSRLLSGRSVSLQDIAGPGTVHAASVSLFTPRHALFPTLAAKLLSAEVRAQGIIIVVQELWVLLHSASTNPSGIPESFEAKERERLKQRADALAAQQARPRCALQPCHLLRCHGENVSDHTSCSDVARSWLGNKRVQLYTWKTEPLKQACAEYRPSLKLQGSASAHLPGLRPVRLAAARLVAVAMMAATTIHGTTAHRATTARRGTPDRRSARRSNGPGNRRTAMATASGPTRTGMIHAISFAIAAMRVSALMAETTCGSVAWTGTPSAIEIGKRLATARATVATRLIGRAAPLTATERRSSLRSALSLRTGSGMLSAGGTRRTGHLAVTRGQ
jgi:hypothetical protein